MIEEEEYLMIKELAQEQEITTGKVVLKTEPPAGAEVYANPRVIVRGIL